MGHRASSPTSLKLASAWLLQKPPPRDKKRAIASSDFGLLSSFRRLPSLVAVEQQLSAKAKEPPAHPPPPPSPCSPGAWSPDGMCGLGRGAAAHRLPNSPLKVQQLDSRDVSPVVAVDHMCVSPGLITSCRNRHWDLVLGLLSLPSGIERIRVGQPKQEPHDQGQTKASGFRASRVWAVLWLSIREHSLTMGKPVSTDCSSFERILALLPPLPDFCGFVDVQGMIADPSQYKMSFRASA